MRANESILPPEEKFIAGLPGWISLIQTYIWVPIYFILYYNYVHGSRAGVESEQKQPKNRLQTYLKTHFFSPE
jgi:hypothetical protein